MIRFSSTQFPLLFCNHLAEENKAGFYTLIAFLLACGCLCSVSLNRSAVGLPVVC